MRNSNLAYDENYMYRETETRRVEKITNKRTSGGVMIKSGNARKKKGNTKTASRKSKKAQANRGTVISVAILCVMAFAVLFRGLMLTSGYEQLEQKNATLSATIAENQKLQFKIDQALDLNNIEQIAQNNFNMSQPSKSQTIYINLDQANEVKKVSNNDSIFDAVKNFFGAIVEYFA